MSLSGGAANTGGGLDPGIIDGGADKQGKDKGGGGYVDIRTAAGGGSWWGWGGCWIKPTDNIMQAENSS